MRYSKPFSAKNVAPLVCMNDISFRLQSELMADRQAVYCCPFRRGHAYPVPSCCSLVDAICSSECRRNLGAKRLCSPYQDRATAWLLRRFRSLCRRLRAQPATPRRRRPRTLEISDLKTSSRLCTVAGFGNPRSILVCKGVFTVFITDRQKENATIRDADTYAKKQTVNLTPGSDTAKYDTASNALYVVTGDKEDAPPRGDQS